MMLTPLSVVASGHELSTSSLKAELFVVVPLAALRGDSESDGMTHHQTIPTEDAEPTWEDAEWR